MKAFLYGFLILGFSLLAYITSKASMQINVIDGAEATRKSDIYVILTDDYLNEDLARFNQSALHLNRPWMLVRPVGTLIWLGPIFCPEETGCWQCLAHRLRTNRPINAYIQQHQATSSSLQPPNSTLPSTVQTAWGMAATELLKWIVQKGQHPLKGSLLVLDTLSPHMQFHPLVKRPQCSQCGQPDLLKQVRPLVLGNRQKRFTTDGGHRCVLPQETLQKYQHHISPMTGVIRKIESIAPPSNGLFHAYIGHHGFALSRDDLAGISRSLMGGSAGKGKTDLQARASVLCEALERYSGVFQGDEPRIKASAQSLSDKAIDPNDCMGFSPRQYEERHHWNANCQTLLRQIPEPFDAAEEREWTPVWSLTHQDFKYLPTAYCYFGYPKSVRSQCWADSNGCASGNTLEEAILHGFMELVERDSIALWWYNRLPKPAVDLDSFDDPYFQQLKT